MKQPAHSGKGILSVTAALLLILALSGCAGGRTSPSSTARSGGGTTASAQATQPTQYNRATVIKTAQVAPDGFRSVRLTFFDHTPMQCDMVVPEGWELRPVNDQQTHEALSPVDIYVGNARVGYVGNWDYSGNGNPGDIDESSATYYVSIYSQLMLGAHYNWDNEYTPVRRTDTAASATCRVFYDKNITQAGKVHYNDGILSYDKTLEKYVQMEIEDGLLTKEQLRTIAASIRLSPVTDRDIGER